jgi:hypothetical protein
MKAPLLASLPLAFALLACSGDKSLVALSARVEAPTLSVQSSTVGGDATGGFDLILALGEYASEETEVSLGTFSIQGGDMELLSPLPLAGAKFPVSLGVGKKVTLPLTFDKPVEPEVATALCQGQVAIKGTLMDSLSHDHPTTVASPGFSAACN